jgi:hypothetical protein
MNKPQKHTRQTESLARLLKSSELYDWLVTEGYFPESYVLPPCFHVMKHPRYGKRFFPFNRKSFKPGISQICDLPFPKSEFTDRTFGIIAPDINNDIAYEIATFWGTILDLLFDIKKLVYSYSFPVPVSSTGPGKIGGLRAGRMIYEWIEMAENDLAEEAYTYKYLVRTDIKNFYPSVYTHSIAWAFHGKLFIRSDKKRYDFSLLGNRIDKLFQNANDGCTNGLPIGPVVSDLISEVILSVADLSISAELQRMNALAVRFKDDYRFLCKTEEESKRVVKLLQKELKALNLLLNEEKTNITELPEGIFREWVSKYDAIRPRKRRRLTFREFKELYLGVLRIDEEVPGKGIIDRFIADITDKSYKPLFPISTKHIGKTISLLFLLAERRLKSFPRVLGLIESMLVPGKQSKITAIVEAHLNKLLKDLCANPDENSYRISWILYFLKSNKLKVRRTPSFSDLILRSIQTNRSWLFSGTKEFRLFRGVRAARKAGSLLQQLDVFSPQ